MCMDSTFKCSAIFSVLQFVYIYTCTDIHIHVYHSFLNMLFHICAIMERKETSALGLKLF